MNTAIYKIDTLSNLHVGSGDTNFGVIDNKVQRDATTDIPTINGSSLKGALKEFFEELGGQDDFIKKTFGNENNAASFKFIPANLLAIPVRSNKKPYFLATCLSVLDQYFTDVNNYTSDTKSNPFSAIKPEEGKPVIFGEELPNLLIEDFKEYETILPIENTLFDCENLVILHNDDFKKICDDTNLPVIARNKIGENLWYEQVVPHKSEFYFTLFSANNTLLEKFTECTNDKIIFIGANSTVGYGLTKISKIN